jgi:N6-adenosine-specific RNA methylase IME4
MIPLSGFPRHQFRCVLADPPWTHENWSDKGNTRISAKRIYPVMALGDIAALPVRSVCDIDCWLFLWAVGSMLPQALYIMRAWGFVYSSVGFTWAKLNRSGRGYFMGGGKTTRKNAEWCLLGRRGSPAINNHGVAELIVAPVREHSRKPDEQYERIERFCDGPRLELFARGRCRAGWRCWGNEADDNTRE